MSDVTPPLEEFRRAYEADDNIWWATACRHHQNLSEAACDELDKARRELANREEKIKSALMRALEMVAADEDDGIPHWAYQELVSLFGSESDASSICPDAQGFDSSAEYEKAFDEWLGDRVERVAAEMKALAELEPEMDVRDNCGTECDSSDLTSGLCEDCLEDVEGLREVPQ